MGEVYRARDTRLERDVALKLLPDTFAADPDRIARFEREAQHPRRAQPSAHRADLRFRSAAESSHALVMELVEGDDLSQLHRARPAAARRGAPDRAADRRRARSRARARHHSSRSEAREHQGAAGRHGQGARFRPREGARATRRLSDHAASDLQRSRRRPMTHAGMILGTAAYMSPEQARGKRGGQARDIWAFGCVLYEMLTAARAFSGDDVADTLAAVLRAEPEWALLPPLPPTITDLLHRSLTKDPRARLSDVAVVKYLLDQPAAVVAAPQQQHLRSRWSYIIPAACAVAALVIGGWAGWSFRETPVVEPARFAIPMVGSNSFSFGGPAQDLAISPDGRTLVYVTGNGPTDSQAMLRTLDQPEFTPIAGAQPAASPFFSPDGRWLGFTSPGFIKTTLIGGGTPTPRIVAHVTGTPIGATWTADGAIIFATSDPATGLFEVPAQGGEPRLLTTPDAARGEAEHVLPVVLPDDRSVLFTIKTGPAREDANVAIYDRASGQYHVLLQECSHAQYLAPGFLVYGAGSAINAVRFDLRTRRVTGVPVAIVDGVAAKATGAFEFSVSDTGTLFYRVPITGANLGVRTLAWVDRNGHDTPIAAPPRLYAYARLAPDERSIAVDSRDQQQDIWLWSTSRLTLTRVTLTPGLEASPIWTPDGKELVFASQSSGGTAGATANLFMQTVNGTDKPRRLGLAARAQIPTSISGDGGTLIFNEVNPGTTGVDIMSMSMSTRTSSALLQTNFNESNGILSPDGRLLAYQSDESGEMQIYVRSLAGGPTQVWPVSSGGGNRPLWARDGSELFYVDARGALIAVRVNLTPAFTAGAPVKVVDPGFFPGSGAVGGRTYDVSADGKRFLVLRDVNPTQASSTPQMVVVMNWVELVRRQLAAAER